MSAPSTISSGSTISDDLVRRAPSGYLWNQALSFWQYFSLLLFQLVITRTLPNAEKGIYELVLSAATVALYLAALGLESAGSVYLPRMLAEGGPGKASAIALRLIVIRVLAVTAVAAGCIWGLPALAGLLVNLGVPGSANLAQSLGDRVLLAHRLVLAGYVASVGLANLGAALLTALLRTRIVFIAGGLAQLFSVGLAVIFIGPLHADATGALAALTVPNAVIAVAYIVALFHVLAARPQAIGERVTAPMLQLGVAAWLADLANGSLIKALAIAQLSTAVSLGQIAFFGVAFEMGHAAAFLFVAGLGGVGLAVMSAAYVGRQRAHLATAWRTVSKLQVVLAVPLVAFCVPHADAITVTLFGPAYAGAGPLVAIFLALNALVRLCGGGSSEAALYVLGRQRWVVVARWGSLAMLGVGDVLLIPRYGVAGALLAVGLAQLAAEIFELVLAWMMLQRAYPIGFIARVLVALAPALAFAVAWRPTSLVELIAAGLGYTVLFLVCLRLIRPLDPEDRTLLGSVAPRLRALLLPFAHDERLSRPTLEPAPVSSGAARD